MSRFIQKQGFTLIELMVVIVIIGVLASLAIPRFTEASAKAKIAEAPRVLASYESAFLAAVAELPPDQIENVTGADLVFETPTDSKWFTYDATVAKICDATARGNIGPFTANAKLATEYIEATGEGDDAVKDHFEHKSTLPDVAKKMVPNFCSQIGGDGEATSACSDID